MSLKFRNDRATAEQQGRRDEILEAKAALEAKGAIFTMGPLGPGAPGAFMAAKCAAIALQAQTGRRLTSQEVVQHAAHLMRGLPSERKF